MVDMEDYDVKRLGLILAVQAEIEGMKADNEQYKKRNSSPKFVGAHFDAKAEEIRNMAYAHGEQL